MKFNAEYATKECIKWIKEWFEQNGPDCNAIIGISGGKDSTVAAALLVDALGKDRVIGVMMPNGKQADIDDSVKVCKHLGIKNYMVNINEAVRSVISSLIISGVTEKAGGPTNQTMINLPPRIRMATLYAISQSNNGRVVNTCNYSEDYVGYSTKYGDAAGDFSPLKNLTVTEIMQIGDYLKLPYELVHKTPSDGLCGKSDEDNLGFTYADLDRYIRFKECEDERVKELIDRKHEQNIFKMKPMPYFDMAVSNFYTKIN